jgi:hypothetical protein
MPGGGSERSLTPQVAATVIFPCTRMAPDEILTAGIRHLATSRYTVALQIRSRSETSGTVRKSARTESTLRLEEGGVRGTLPVQIQVPRDASGRLPWATEAATKDPRPQVK